MDAPRILQLEMIGFFAGLTALIGYRMLTRQINLSGLLNDGVNQDQVSPERVQLLVATLGVSAQFIGSALHGSGTSLPHVSVSTLAVFGASGTIYTAVKGLRIYKLFQLKKRNGV